ncbi:hypothetical protein [Halorubrum pallidum]|uniref:Uncharacterized protein n=1 Tax=Halorubrum pallidum TaxID=1526114 RepID=A0ABD5T1B7_9EURY
MTYPTKEQHARWKKEAEQMDMSLSEFIQAMTEAGMKKFDVDVEMDESLDEVRRQRNDLKSELDRTRDRLSDLEEQVQSKERAEIKSFVEDNPGANLQEISQRVVETAADRAIEQVNQMVTIGELQYENGEYYI